MWFPKLIFTRETGSIGVYTFFHFSCNSMLVVTGSFVSMVDQISEVMGWMTSPMFLQLRGALGIYVNFGIYT